MRIEGSLDLAEGFIQRVAEHLAHERAANQTIAMLARKRAAEFEHQIRHGLGEAFELGDALLGLHVDHGPHVQASDGGVRVDSGRGSVIAHDLQEPADVLAQFFGRDGRVFDERDRLGVFLHRHRETQRGFAQAPDACLRDGIGIGVIAVTELARAQIFL